jgi:3-hydroxyisobutyrate dehydrogenase
MANIGFIGLGNMGGPMAQNLVKAGHNVSVFDLSHAAMQTVVDAGAMSTETAITAATDKDFVITMLPAGKHVEGLYLDDAFLANLTAGTRIIDCSTIDAETAKRVASGLAEKGFSFIDAPVSGGVAGAAAGTLTFIVGGSKENFDAASSILDNMGKNVFHAGDVGAGQVAKICNNMLLSILMAGTSEALQMGIDNGLDPKVLSDIMLQSSGRNWTLELYNPCPGVIDSVPSSNNYQGGFMVDLMLKDLGLAMDTAQTSKSATPLGSLAQSLYRIHAQHGKGSNDFSSIFEMFSADKS